MVKIVILNDTRSSHKDKIDNDLKAKVKVSVTEVGKTYNF